MGHSLFSSVVKGAVPAFGKIDELIQKARCPGAMAGFKEPTAAVAKILVTPFF
jgi:hypothetical protein